jgi:hypothetical protein
MGHEVGGSPFSDDLCEVPSRLNTSSDRESELRAAVVALRGSWITPAPTLTCIRAREHATAPLSGAIVGPHPVPSALRYRLKPVSDHDLT